MNDAEIDAYLARIGAARPATLDAATLADLQERHLNTVPFENLSIHLGERIVLEEKALFDKLVQRRRGGFCYELNGAFAALLRGLGFHVTLLSAKVFQPDGSLTMPFDHLVLRVDLDEPWLVDVGFGRHARRPLRLSTDQPQQDAEGTFQVVDAPDGDRDVLWNGRPVCRVELRARELSDFGPTCWWQATSPDSHFTGFLTCSLPTPRGRVTLSGNLLIETVDGERSKTTLGSDEEIRATYLELFGVPVDRLPSILHPRD